MDIGDVDSDSGLWTLVHLFECLKNRSVAWAGYPKTKAQSPKSKVLLQHRRQRDLCPQFGLTGFDGRRRRGGDLRRIPSVHHRNRTA